MGFDKYIRLCVCGCGWVGVEREKKKRGRVSNWISFDLRVSLQKHKLYIACSLRNTDKQVHSKKENLKKTRLC